MHSLTICFGPTVWTFLFKEEERAKAAYEVISNPDIENLIITDDFGQTACLKAAMIHGFMIDDMEQSIMAQVERGLHQARAQARAQTRAMADPVIKESLRQQQGPAVMSPVPGGRFS